MKKVAIFFSLLVLFIFQSCSVPAQEQEAHLSPIEVEVAKASELIDQGNVLLLDVRTPAEVNQGYIAGARNIDIASWDKFKAGVDKLDKSDPVIVYCKVGGRSHQAAVYLVENGFTQVYDIKGGILAWEKAGEPLKKD